METKLFGVSAAPLEATATKPPFYSVLLQDGWYKKLDLESFNNWIDSQGIDGDDWNFLTRGFTGQRLLFRREEDAIACKLKFRL